MKSRIFKTSTVLVVLFALFAAISTSAYAADGELVVNSKATAKVGDKITYNLNLSDCEVPIIGLQMYISYDSTKLKYVDKSLNFEKIDGVVSNPNLDNMVAITWTDIQNETDFSKKASLLSLQFEVIGSGDCEISYFIAHMYGKDMGYIKNFTFTNDISVNDTEVIDSELAIVTNDEAFVKEHSGSFINYDDSMGENSPNSDQHATIVVTRVVDVTKNVVADNGSSGGNSVTTSTVFVLVGAIIIILAIVAVIIIKKRDEANNS